MTYYCIKGNKKAGFHPLFKGYIFGKTKNHFSRPTPSPPPPTIFRVKNYIISNMWHAAQTQNIKFSDNTYKDKNFSQEIFHQRTYAKVWVDMWFIIYLSTCSTERGCGAGKVNLVEVVALQNLAKFTGKHLCQCLFFNKVARRPHLLESLFNKTTNLKEIRKSICEGELLESLPVIICNRCPLKQLSRCVS